MIHPAENLLYFEIATPFESRGIRDISVVKRMACNCINLGSNPSHDKPLPEFDLLIFIVFLERKTSHTITLSADIDQLVMLHAKP